MPENPTLTDYDAQHGDVAAAEPTPDPRVVALQALTNAEQHREWAARSLARAEIDDQAAENRLLDAREAYSEAMKDTRL